MKFVLIKIDHCETMQLEARCYTMKSWFNRISDIVLLPGPGQWINNQELVQERCDSKDQLYTFVRLNNI